jgi:hypothetical protein
VRSVLASSATAPLAWVLPPCATRLIQQAHIEKSQSHTKEPATQESRKRCVRMGALGFHGNGTALSSLTALSLHQTFFYLVSKAAR